MPPCVAYGCKNTERSKNNSQKTFHRWEALTKFNYAKNVNIVQENTAVDTA